MESKNAYIRGFVPYASAAFLIGIVGGFSTVLGPAFVKQMGIDYQNTTWTALAQAMSTAACAPILGKLGDLIGRRITLLLGVAVFTLGNILSALAGSLTFMLVARFVVGVGTAAMTPVIMAYIVSEFPQDKVATGFSLYMLLSSVAVVFGPTLGGLIIANYGWKAMLWVCVAICTVTFAICLMTAIPEVQRKQKPQHFDGFGAALVILFFSLVLCIPSFGQNFGWSSGRFLGVLFLGLISLAGLLVAENYAENPILPGNLMRRKGFFLSVIALFLTQGLMQANMTNTIIFMNYTQPNNTLISGYGISVMYLGMSLGAVIIGPLADRFEPKAVLTGSLLLTGVGCGLLFGFSEKTSALLLMASLGILGFGLGGNGTIFMKVALSNLSLREAGAGTGTYGLFRDLAAPFGVAVFVPMFTNKITDAINAGEETVKAAVHSVHTLALAELCCIGAGIATVLLLPNIHVRREKE